MFLTTLLSLAEVVVRGLAMEWAAAAEQVVIELLGIAKHLAVEAQVKLV